MKLTMTTGRWVALVVSLLMLLSISSAVWAAPDQYPPRQTVPTRTPTKVADTPVPTEAPQEATATPKPKKDQSQPEATQAPTEAVAEPTSEVQAEATSAVIAEAGYPQTGAEHSSLLLMAGILASGTLIVALWLRSRPAR